MLSKEVTVNCITDENVGNISCADIKQLCNLSQNKVQWI